jgi:hypothetical protein
MVVYLVLQQAAGKEFLTDFEQVVVMVALTDSCLADLKVGWLALKEVY